MLAETYPDARIELDFDDPFQLLVVTVLSAQTTDRRVNAVRPDPVRRLPRPARDGGRSARAPRADHRAARLLPGQDRLAAQAQRRPRRAVRRPGAAAARRPGDPPRRRPQDRQRRPRQRLRRSPASPSTPTSAGWPAASAGPTRPTRSRSSTPSAPCSRKGLGDALPPPDLARPPDVSRQEAGVRRVPARPDVPVVRRGAGRPGRRREAREDRGAGMRTRLLTVLVLPLLVALLRRTPVRLRGRPLAGEGRLTPTWSR